MYIIQLVLHIEGKRTWSITMSTPSTGRKVRQVVHSDCCDAMQDTFYIPSAGNEVVHVGEVTQREMAQKIVFEASSNYKAGVRGSMLHFLQHSHR